MGPTHGPLRDRFLVGSLYLSMFPSGRQEKRSRFHQRAHLRQPRWIVSGSVLSPQQNVAPGRIKKDSRRLESQHQLLIAYLRRHENYRLRYGTMSRQARRGAFVASLPISVSVDWVLPTRVVLRCIAERGKLETRSRRQRHHQAQRELAGLPGSMAGGQRCLWTVFLGQGRRWHPQIPS